MIRRLETDVAIIGGGMGGVAAALAVLEAGYRVILSEETDWLGGQMTSQGVSALDEHKYIETFSPTRSYSELRQRIRQYYQERYDLPALMPDGTTPLNPGNGWVSRLCFEPRVGEQVIREMLEPYLPEHLSILYRHHPISAEVKDDRVQSVTLQAKDDTVTIHAACFLDATELGDLLPLTQTAFVSGAEAREDTGEPHAADIARPQEVQSFTFPFALEYRPGEDHTIPKPSGYEQFRDSQPYSLTIEVDHGVPKHYPMFTGDLPFWTYRRLLDAALLKDENVPHDVSMINWPGNDYDAADIISASKTRRRTILREARALSLGFLYWLQTEAPRDEGGYGYPELKLRKDVMETRNGLSKYPYIRESRRIVALDRVLEQHISKDSSKGARAKNFMSSVGIGWYQMDLHACVGNKAAAQFAETLPFQIPLGALIPKDTLNLLASCKNIGTTHLTNGAYRLHPVEWAIGEAAGTLAAYCLSEALAPRHVWKSEVHARALQQRLLTRGTAIAWAIDVPNDHALFIPAQWFVIGHLNKDSFRYQQLTLALEQPFTVSDAAQPGATSDARSLGACLLQKTLA